MLLTCGGDVWNAFKRDQEGQKKHVKDVQEEEDGAVYWARKEFGELPRFWSTMSQVHVDVGQVGADEDGTGAPGQDNEHPAAFRNDSNSNKCGGEKTAKDVHATTPVMAILSP